MLADQKDWYENTSPTGTGAYLTQTPHHPTFLFSALLSFDIFIFDVFTFDIFTFGVIQMIRPIFPPRDI
jgi:hypothetical protein